MAFGIAALSAIIFYPPVSTFADDDDRHRPEVKSAKLRCKGRRSDDDRRCECKTQNRFRTRNAVYAKGEHFPPFSTVDIYVTPNRKWERGDPIGTDVSTDGVNQVATDDEGEFHCTKIWADPLTVGMYDIIVDANQDGTYNAGDAIDGRRRNPGFKVR